MRLRDACVQERPIELHATRGRGGANVVGKLLPLALAEVASRTRRDAATRRPVESREHRAREAQVTGDERRRRRPASRASASRRIRSRESASALSAKSMRPVPGRQSPVRTRVSLTWTRVTARRERGSRSGRPDPCGRAGSRDRSSRRTRPSRRGRRGRDALRRGSDPSKQASHLALGRGAERAKRGDRAIVIRVANELRPRMKNGTRIDTRCPARVPTRSRVERRRALGPPCRDSRRRSHRRALWSPSTSAGDLEPECLSSPGAARRVAAVRRAEVVSSQR